VSDPAPRFLYVLEQMVKAINSAFTLLASGLVVLIVAIVLYAIVTRIVGISALWTHDVTQFAFLYVFFLALAPALQSGHHITVELFDDAVPKFLRRYVFHIAGFLVLLFGCVLFWQVWKTTVRAFSDNRLAVAAIAVPLKWIYIAGPIGVAQFILTVIVQLGRAQWPAEGQMTKSTTDADL